MGVSFYFVYLKKFYHNIKFIFTKDKNTQHNIKKDLDEIDYFLIDANCLIHPMCFKTIADNPNITNYDELEDKMMITITNYLQYIIEHVNPKKGVFIAVDGVCPAAKIKHQRSRRYKTAYDKILYDDIKKKYSKAIITSWSNSAITPGTLFMAKLHNYLSEWCKKIKINIDLIYSSYKIPGEGEHKLLQFIKDNNTNNKKFSYVIYGADADLIFLSLLANVKIYLMRENSEITKDSSMSVEELNYISIDILKDLIFDTFNQKYKSKKLGNIQLSKSNIINDYIFISYFLGNDFLPHLLALSIKHNGVDYLIDNYINTFHEINKNKQIPEYIIESNNINDNFLIYLFTKMI